MPLIDDDGNLFGVVNVIDALVVVVLLAVLVAGVAVISGLGGSDDVDEEDESEDLETRYATVELGEQPDYVAEQLEEGDHAEISGWGSGEATAMATVTDTDVTDPATNNSSADRAEVTIRLEIEGTAAEDDRGLEVFQVEGEPLALGSDLTIDRGTYVTSGTITALDADGPTLEADEFTATDAEVER